MPFEALEVSLEVIRSLWPPLARIRTRDPKLYQQIRSAANSISLNLAEGRRRHRKDKTHLWSIAAGSADEVSTALRNAVAWGDIEEEAVARTLELLDRVLAMLWRLRK